LSDETLRNGGKKMEKFKDFLIKEAEEDFDVYWWIQNWVDRKWDEYNET
jgi:hypothetical protein